jgi:hypothetical protein
MEEHRLKKLLDQVHACPEFILSLRRTSRRDAIGLKRHSYRAEELQSNTAESLSAPTRR